MTLAEKKWQQKRKCICLNGARAHAAVQNALNCLHVNTPISLFHYPYTSNCEADKHGEHKELTPTLHGCTVRLLRAPLSVNTHQLRFSGARCSSA